ncbi:MAG: hypothetical protein NTV93_12830 [Verrucomicrobia bacterium]|nr:hypothetical protein [Verrucomicrobiota bacterium]
MTWRIEWREGGKLRSTSRSNKEEAHALADEIGPDAHAALPRTRHQGTRRSVVQQLSAGVTCTAKLNPKTNLTNFQEFPTIASLIYI